jgi:hypothetical protein
MVTPDAVLSDIAVGGPLTPQAVALAAQLGWFAWGDSIAAAMATLVVAVRAGGLIGARDRRPYWTAEAARELGLGREMALREPLE